MERYTLKDASTYTYEATITDATVFSETWQIKFDSDGSRNRNNCWNTVAWKEKVTVSTTRKTQAA